MAANNYTKYDKDFKNHSSHSTKMGKRRLSSVKNMVFPNLPWANG